MRLRKQGGIRHETPRLGPAAIEAEVVNLHHSAASDTGGKMLLGLTPGLKCSSIQVGSMILEEAID
jgi:hypothetical protein